MTTANITYNEPLHSENRRYLRYAQFLNGAIAILATAVGLWILISPERRIDPAWLFWLIWPMATLHTVEEYIFPGGFLTYFNKVAFQSVDAFRPLSAKRAFQTDALTGVFNPILILIISQVYFPLIFVFVFLLWFNAYFHITETIKSGKYFPGVLTAIILYVPGFSYIIYFYLSRGLVSPFELGLTFLGGLGLTAIFFSKVRDWQRTAA